ncbi:MAG: TorF family putative porin [Acidobacteriota bacterium]|nr:TorF family putative porin [Acidobacteriota bacterium]
MLRHLGKCLLLIAGLATVLAGSPVQAAGVAYGFAFASAYVWRDLTVVDEGVWQPSFTMSHDNGFSFNTWGDYYIDDVNRNDGEFTEVDLTADYAPPLEGKTGVNIGVIEYPFPNTGGTNNATTEIYAGLSWDSFAAPFITAYYDIDVVDDLYISFGAIWGRYLFRLGRMGAQPHRCLRR